MSYANDPTTALPHDIDIEWEDANHQSLVSDHYHEGQRETNMTINLTSPDARSPYGSLVSGEDFAHDLADFRQNIGDYTTENFDRIVRSDEIQFGEYIAQLYYIGKESKLLLGKLCWERLQNALGFMLANESPERNSMIGNWCLRIGTDLTWYELNQYILAAKAQALVPSTQGLSITAQAEIARDAGESEEEQRETIREREDSVRELDPTLSNTTETVRTVKQAEKNGNHKPSMYRMKDLSEEQVICDHVVMGQIKVKEMFDEESGEIVPVYEYHPVLRIYMDEPPSEELRDQVKTYQNALLRRLGVKNADHGNI